MLTTVLRDAVQNSGSDGKLGYLRTSLMLGLSLRVFEDAVAEGNGELITTMWKFLVPFLRNSQSNLYAFAG